MGLPSSSLVCIFSGRRAVMVAVAMDPFEFRDVSVMEVASCVANRIMAVLSSTCTVALFLLTTFIFAICIDQNYEN
jgi:hypothetical protein